MTIRLSRRAALTAIGGGLALTALSTTEAIAEPTLVRVSMVPIFDVAPLFAADQQGFFAAENIAITTQQTQGGTVGIPGLLGGNFDIVYTNAPTAVIAIEKGIDLRIIIQGAGLGKAPPDPAALLKRKGDPYKSGKDFEGKSIAINQRGNIQWMIVRSWIKATGGDPEKVDLREVPIPQQLDALKNKQVDAALVTDPFLTIGLTDGSTFELLDWAFNRVYAGGPAAFWVTTDQYVSSRAATVRGFVRAYKKGVAWVNANRGKEPLTKLLSSYTHIEPGLLSKINIPSASATIESEKFPQLLAIMRENGMISSNVDLKSKVFT